MTIRKMRVPMLYRHAEITDDMARGIDVEERLLRGVVFSTETAVPRWFGDEILDHSPDAVDLARVESVGSVLLNHDPDRAVAKPVNLRIEGKRGMSDAKFGTKPLAEEAFLDVREGVLRGVSVGYVPKKMDLVSKEEGKRPVYRITKWQVLEWSLTPIPADPRSKTGQREDGAPEFREEDPVYECEVEEPDTQREERAVKNCQKCGRSYDGDSHTCETGGGVAVLQRDEVIGEERSRVKGINALADRHKMQEVGRQFIESGKSVSEFRDAILEKLGAHETSLEEIRQVAETKKRGPIGMSREEIKRFSFFRLLRALAARHPELGVGRAAIQEATFELEACEAQAKRMGKTPQGAFIPYEIMYGWGREEAPEQRDVTKTTEGADLVTNLVLGSSFIDLLRNKSIAVRLATTLSGLKEDIILPRLSAGATAQWVAENVAPTESTQTFDQVALSPNSLSCYSEISRKLIIQSSPDVEAIIRSDLIQAVALEIDRAAIAGNGVGAQPAGIINIGGIGSVTTGGTPSWAETVELWSDVAGGNADFGRLAFLMSARVAAIFMTTPKEAGMPVYLMAENQTILGYPVYVTNQVPSTTPTAVVIFGNWQDLLIGIWDTLDILIDPYGVPGLAGLLRIRLLHEVDIALRRLASFSTMEDIV